MLPLSNNQYILYPLLDYQYENYSDIKQKTVKHEC